MRFRFSALLVLLPFFSLAQGPKVPARMEFADLKLRINDDARAEIQKDVDRLRRSPTYFNKQVEKAKSYFPIIERIFAKEKLPDDFKYLVLQESGLVSDAVSSSKAVGFWQFKDFTAMEVGLRIDRHVDERMNIVSASRGAARYLKKNNFTYFDNWLMALQAYQMGAGAALKVGADKHRGAKTMVINKKTYWYVKKYLAHKIAYQDEVRGEGQLKLIEHRADANETLAGIAGLYRVEVEEVKQYNKWLKRGKVPGDKEYVVVVPSDVASPALLASNTLTGTGDVQVANTASIEYNFDDPAAFPRIKEAEKASIGKVITINGLSGIIAGPEDKIPQLAKKGKVELGKFLTYNDLSIDDKIKAGQVYYLKPKRSKAKTHYHVARSGETLWDIAQKYGVKLKKLKAKNRIKDEAVKPGRVIWLRYIRPVKVPVEYREVEPARQGPVQVVEHKEENKEIPNSTIETEEEEAPVADTPVNRPRTFLEKLDSLERLENIQTPIKQDSAPVNTDPEEVSASEKVAPPVPGQEDGPVQMAGATSTPDSVQRIHTVIAGETYYAISKKYGTSVINVLEWNNLDINDKLSIGQELIVFEKKTGPSKADPDISGQSAEDQDFTLYTVNEGDTLYSIARNHGVTIQDIVQWNNKKELSIRLGEKIKIKKATKVK